ncbi:DUF3422 family protein [Brucella cytisi]|uniref:DUF3422 family protein n=1 Tax=Brucella cytisi TaxID=407152 RepID=UPI0008FC2708|nr:DUF3422 family protein [Brucella cytisi]
MTSTVRFPLQTEHTKPHDIARSTPVGRVSCLNGPHWRAYGSISPSSANGPYYVVGLLGYTLKGVLHTVPSLQGELAMSILSPIVILFVALFLRHRTKHTRSTLMR